MKNILFVLLLFLIICLIQCSSGSGPDDKNPPRELTVGEQELVSSDNNFGLKLFREVINEESDKNVFISPLSVSMALGMTYNGAAGETREAMKNTLELNDLSIQEVNESYQSLIKLLRNLDDKVIFQIANSIWCREGLDFEEDFLNVNKDYFDALVRTLDFSDAEEAERIINNWVEENTNGKIKKMLDGDINDNGVITAMFLINAIYFKGTWTYAFNKDSTKDKPFYLSNGTQTTCKMMEQTREFNFYMNEDFQAIDLPYGDSLYSMTVFLPHPNKDINAIIEKFNDDNWNRWMNSFGNEEVILHFPKFKLEYEIELNDALKALGMEIAFDDRADFSNMSDSLGLFIDKVKHKTFIDVYEEGTEAAAATSVEMGYKSSGSMSLNFNRPFVFAIRENHSGTILFIGKVVEPKVD